MIGWLGFDGFMEALARCRYEYCGPMRRCLFKLIPFILTIVLALFVGWYMYPERSEAKRWAKVDDFNAWWAGGDAAHRVGLSLKFSPGISCRRYTVTKVVYPINKDGTVEVGRPIVLTGTLPEQIAKVPIGQTETLYDQAVIEGTLLPGTHYELQLTIGCEPTEGGKTLLDTGIIKTILTVPADPERQHRP